MQWIKFRRSLRSPYLLKWLFNVVWPVWWFSGIKVTHISRDFRSCRVRMSLRFYNQNYVGTHFGGNLYAMTDPFYMLMVINNLSQAYWVWDQAATITFISPGKHTVTAEFNLSNSDLDDILANTAQGQKYVKDFYTDILDTQGNQVAKLKKSVYIRKKKAAQ